MSTLTRPRPYRRAPSAFPAAAGRPVVGSLPPAGPSWFGSLMGTGILATLLGLHAPAHPGLLVPATLLLVTAWMLLGGLTAAFTRRVVMDRTVLTASVTDPAVAPMWGCVAMGLLSAGSATLAVTPQVAPALSHTAVAADVALWCGGTLLGLATTAAFLRAAATLDLGRPTPVWGLPVVAPMVSATTGAGLVPHVPGPGLGAALLAGSAACFVVSLVLGAVVFAAAYRTPLPLAAFAAAWIPLGVVGQSMAAAQALVTQSERFLEPATASSAHRLADAYGFVMLAAAGPVVAFAVRRTVRGFRAGMPFAPGWWSLTFPLGTLALGGHLLGLATGSALATAVGVGALMALTGTWTLCAVATLRAVTGRR